MLNLSDILIGHPELESFDELVEVVKIAAASERFFRMDVRPPYPDTPHNWEDVLEGCLLYTSPSPRDATLSRMPSSA